MDCKQTKPNQNRTKQKATATQTYNKQQKRQNKNPTKHTRVYIHILEYKHGDEGNVKTLHT